MKTIKRYYALTKPGLIYGNLLSAIGGFFLGAGVLDTATLLATIVGLFLVIASGCVCNNYIDREIDTRMERTQHRALPAKEISPKQALWFATALLLVGSSILFLYTNPLALSAALFGFVTYVFIYSFAKHKTPYALHLGAISGAMPPVVGYSAATHTIDLTCLLLFAVLFAWQIPHFLSISLFRKDEYRAAKVPVWPIAKGNSNTKRHIALYTELFFFCLCVLLFTIGARFGYSVAVVAFGWLLYAIFGFFGGTPGWARGMFYYSLAILLLLCGALILHRWII